MRTIKDLTWKKNITAAQLVRAMGDTGLQAAELQKASETILRMKRNGAKIFLTFTSNMVTSGLRGFFAQLIKLGVPDMIVTTVGGIEEDMMKAKGEKFLLGSFSPDDTQLYEQGTNRVGNIYIQNESYCQFETMIGPMLKKMYEKIIVKPYQPTCENLLLEIVPYECKFII